MKRDSKFLSVVTSILIALFCLSAAIAVPILGRDWYYSQVKALDLSALTGFSTEVIHGAFDQVMDFLVKGAPFGTGELQWSQSGMSHFADCRVLFQLDFILLGVSAVGLLLLFLVRLRRSVHHFKGFSPAFWALCGTLVLLLVFGIWAMVDFEGLFTAFHTLCFPGKTNWVFDYRTDQIILILPEAFWARTAALVGMLTLAFEVVLALLGHLLHRLCAPKSVYEVAKRL